MDAVLSDVLVIDLSRAYAGPYSAMMLGDLGAQVIKIERPESGDDTRSYGPSFVSGESAYYLGLNRNKRSITLDFSTPDGKAKLLISGVEARRYGNGHPNITPYQAFNTRNGHMIVACGNDELFDTMCHALERDDLAADERFVTNSQRLRHRHALITILQEHFLQRDTTEWLAILRKAGVPCGPIHKVSQVFHDPQIKARKLVWECEHPTAGTIQLIGSPMHLLETPPRLYKAPPLLGEDNELLES